MMFCNESSDKSKNNTHWLQPNDDTAKKFDLLIRALDKKEYLVIIRTISVILHKNILCNPSSEPSRRDGSDEGLQSMF